SIVRIAGPASGSTFPIGTISITYAATDASGHGATCTFNITVNAAQPACTPPILACPGDIVDDIDNGHCFTNVICGALAVAVPAPTITYDPHGPEAPFARGTTIVTATATNACGSASCTFSVTVGDSDSPLITGCPGDV